MNQGLLIIGVAAALLVIFALRRTLIVVPQQSAFVVERLGQVQPHARRRLPHPGAVRGRDPLPALAEGDVRSTSPRRSASRATTCRSASTACSTCKVLEPRARVVRHLRLHLRDHASWRRRRCAARSARSTSTAPSRSAPTSTSHGRERARQGVGAVGREGAALRDQEHHAAARRPRRDGEADARRAREARRDPDVRGRARRRDQPRRGRQAAGDQGVRGATGSSRSTRPKAQAAAILAVATATAEGIPPGRRVDQRAGRLRGGAAARRRSSTSSSSASSRRRATRSSCPPT